MSTHSVDCHPSETVDEAYYKTEHIQFPHDKMNHPKSTYVINDVDMDYFEFSLKMLKKIYKRVKPIFQANHTNQINSCCRIN